MIRIEKVNKWFNRYRKNKNHVINNTSLTLEDTGLVALLGPSGSGKTTLLNAIGGLDKINSGKIYINNKKISGHNIHRIDKLRNLNIGYIFQDYKLVDNLTVFENVALSLKTIGIKDKKEIERRVLYVLDCVGMTRYRKRPASMLSGGERQRVGIARAIVKNPNIIIADEPTGNLDSKNTLEIMNIIKKISEDRLVILVTHEVNLAKFYASRIIEIEDGQVIKDYKNEQEENLDYSIDNNIYLKDFKNTDTDEKLGVDFYRDNSDSLNIEIVLKGNNIFIKSKDHRKIEVVDEDSSIEFINDHYKTIAKKDLEEIHFDFKDQLNNPSKLHYSSIFNPITFITNGFKKVLEYSLLKKILLLGFLASGFFIMMSVSRIAANLTIHDKDFVDTNKNYLKLYTNSLSVQEYNEYSLLDSVEYIIPGDSIVSFTLKVDDYYQTTMVNANIEGSLSTINMITKDNLIDGRFPENNREIVIDKMVIDNSMKQMNNVNKMIGLKTPTTYLNRLVSIDSVPPYTIVGITDLESPSIYMYDSEFTNVLYNRTKEGNEYYYGMSDEDHSSDIQDYQLFMNRVILKEGYWPENDYETIVNISNKGSMELNKETNKKVNGQKLKVVGYYDSPEPIDKYLVNYNMIKVILIGKAKNCMIYPKDKEKALSEFREKQYNIEDSYDASRAKYIKSRRNGTRVAINSAIIVLGISLIEIILMLRSSFLSRIKEVGIYRAIGLKKKDIYIMFSGEIIAITVFASIPGILISAYIFDRISHIKYLTEEFLVNPFLVIVSILTILLFNLICGLFPVFNTLRKRPAQILSRTDI